MSAENEQKSELGRREIEAIETLAASRRKITGELRKAIVGQDEVIDQLLICLFAQGHCILEGVPGLAKTRLISSLSQTLSLSFNRIQFTPDLMPSDITGTEIIEEDKSSGTRQLRFVSGPVFANVILADEINRTPPKTQAALLEAMQENQVTAAGFTHKLPKPFFVLATQNPIEQEGTYPLPEAQLDRFMFKILVDYPSEEEELRVIGMTTSAPDVPLDRVFSSADILALQEVVRKVPCAEHVMRYAMGLVRATRPEDANGSAKMPQVPEFVRDYVSWGAGPRASLNLVLAGKARAIIHGRFHVSTDDIRAVAHPVLRHRIVTNFNAEVDGVGADRLVERLLEEIPRGQTPDLDAVGADRVLSDG